MISEKAVEAAAFSLACTVSGDSAKAPIWEQHARHALQAALSLHDALVECKQEAVAADYTLPCDVFLPPNTVIRKGCSLATLMAGFRGREAALIAEKDGGK